MALKPQLAILQGIQDSVLARSQVNMPSGWPATYTILAQSRGLRSPSESNVFERSFNDQG